jgi:hypothetical protein
MAQAAGQRDAVILDDYDASVVRFLDAGDPPTVIAPGSVISPSSDVERVFATSSADLVRSLGTQVTSRIIVIARRPDGTPTVYEASP